MIAISYTANLVGTGQFIPLLSTHQVEPAMTFPEIFTGTFGQDIINIDRSRCGSYHCGTVICNKRCIVLVGELPLACPCTDHIDQVAGAFTCYGSGAFHSGFSSYKIEFGEFGNFEWTGAGSIGLAQSCAIIGTVYTQFP